jgi:hydroxymethylglutaryl-CoA lyase
LRVPARIIPAIDLNRIVPGHVVTICDVGPRDGLQNEPETLPPAVRAELVNRLAAAGLPRIEAVSFVRDDRVPRMAGAEEVVAGIDRREGTEYAGLVLNLKGYERLRETGLDRVNCTLAATETFNQRNGNMSLDQALAQAQAILDISERPATVTISVAFGCPFEGRVDPGRVADLCELLDAGEIVLADTIGVATPGQVKSLVERTSAAGVHLHNTRNTGYANAVAALEAGATVLDASVGGLGGCPYAPRATGNIATEDLVYLLEGEGVDTGVDLDALVSVSKWLESVLGRQLEGQVYRAGPWPSRTAPEAASPSISSSE